MRIAQIGNFQWPHCTEAELRLALLHLGHEVVAIQENTADAFRCIDPGNYDLVLWTRTGWNPQDFGLTADQYDQQQRHLLNRARQAKVPVVGYHLDRWWGLRREGEIGRSAFFGVDLLITADGGHQATWSRAGVNHVWMPPAVSQFECEPGTFDPYYASDVAFVGSWEGYHVETTHRFDLVQWVQAQPNAKLWPERGRPAVRGVQLRNLYASTKVNVGDSCLYGGTTHYWSDRIPETLGRGGFLIHPYVDGLWEWFSGEHLVTWERGNFQQLEDTVHHYLFDPGERTRIANAGRLHVLEHHTYTRRMEQMIELVKAL